jgi:hypothetical protein
VHTSTQKVKKNEEPGTDVPNKAQVKSPETDPNGTDNMDYLTENSK